MAKKSKHNSSRKDLRMRQQLAQEAARLISEEGINDFHTAKHKAAERLHTQQSDNLPRNDEIQLALNQYQRLFKSDSQPQQLHQLRQASLKAMRLFQRFKPRLTGAVLDGIANEFSEIDLHLFDDSSEEVALFLLNTKIPFSHCSQKVSMANGNAIEIPCYRLEIYDAPVLLMVFKHKDLRQAPRHPATGKPMQRFNLNKVAALIDST